MPPAPRFLYLHGFASGPDSSKGVALTQRFAAGGVTLERLNLRLPSLEHLRFSAMKAAVKAAIGGERERAVVFGSSLGGLTAARVAEEDARVCALVLLAPAFHLIERWRRRMGEDGWRDWQTRDRLDIDDYAEKRKTTLDFEFARELEALDRGFPDVRVPTIIVHGRGDEAVPVEGSRAFARDRRHVRLVEVDDGHELVASLDRIEAEARAFLRPFLND
jgi:alpha-beta hydrolase superfamily lysophospholipase